MVESSRLLLFENGACLGVFPEESNEFGNGTCLVLESSGASFTHVQQDGVCVRQLSEYCKRDLLPKLSTLTTFRNFHSRRPSVSRRLTANPLTADAHSHLRGRLAGYADSSRPLQSEGSSAKLRHLRVGKEKALLTHRSDDERNAPRHHCRRVSSVAQWPAGPRAARHCTIRADGSVEVRSFGGNARLTLSASHNVAEVDFVTTSSANTAPAFEGTSRTLERCSDDSDVGCVGVQKAEQWDRGGAQLEVHSSEGVHRYEGRCWCSRVWVTQQFLVSAVPEEFAHAVSVALRVAAALTGKIPQGYCEGVWGNGVAKDNGNQDDDGLSGFVSSRLPSPHEKPDHPRWDTVRASPMNGVVDFSEQSDPIGKFSTKKPVDPEHLHLLAVDILKLAEGQGFSGTLAPVVDFQRGCTYRIVSDLANCDDFGQRERQVSVHIVIHADGSEVWLEGDFVRLVRPPFLPDQSSKTRLLHVSATTTFRFCTVPNVSGETSRSFPPVGSHILEPRHTAGTLDNDLINGEYSGSSTTREPRQQYVEICLGDITTRAQALRQHFVAWSATKRSLSRDVLPIVSCGDCGLRIADSHECHVYRAAGVRRFVKAGNVAAFDTDTQPSGNQQQRHGNKRSSMQPPLNNSGWPRGSTRRSHFTQGSASRTPPAPAVSAEVIERVDRAGSSFVLFADGRSRGSFADRTIVTLPTQDRKSVVGLGTGHVPNSTLRDSGLAGGEQMRSGGRPYGYGVLDHFGHVECILPDGTVVRSDYSSVWGERGHVESINDNDNVMVNGADENATGRGDVLWWDSQRAKMFAETKAIHAKHLKPYVLAVRRFCEWAKADPTERRAKSAQSQQNRLAAVAEAEKNRRFVTLRRLQQSAAGHRVVGADGINSAITPTLTAVAEDSRRQFAVSETEPIDVSARAWARDNSRPSSNLTAALEKNTTHTDRCYPNDDTQSGRQSQERAIPMHVVLEEQQSNVLPSVVTPEQCRLVPPSFRASNDKCRGFPVGNVGQAGLLVPPQQATDPTNVSPGAPRSDLGASCHDVRYNALHSSSSQNGIDLEISAGVGARERNEVVRRLLEANRTAELGREASRRVASLRAMR